MKVLLAHSDRDLLSSLSGLWRVEGLEAETAFDGTMVPPLLARGPYGAAVLDEALPRMSHASLMALLRQEGIPVIVLTGERVTVKRLLAPDLANAYLSFPFLPCELRALIDCSLSPDDAALLPPPLLSAVEKMGGSCRVERDEDGVHFSCALPAAPNERREQP